MFTRMLDSCSFSYHGAVRPFHGRRMFALLSLLCVIIALLALPAFSQTNPPPTTVPQFYQTALDWVTHADTNSTIFEPQNCHLELQVGADYVQGVNATASIGLEYHVWQNVVIDSITKNAGIAGTVVSQQLGVGISFHYFNIEFTGLIDGGYDLQRSKAFFEPRLEIKKGLTARTYMGVGLGAKIADFKAGVPVTPTLSAYLGITI